MAFETITKSHLRGGGWQFDAPGKVPHPLNSSLILFVQLIVFVLLLML